MQIQKRRIGFSVENNQKMGRTLDAEGGMDEEEKRTPFFILQKENLD